jgi:ubiquinone/menaquinone biosynthesis C-methylase UbiE
MHPTCFLPVLVIQTMQNTNSDFALTPLQLEPTEVLQASELLLKVLPQEKTEIIDQVVTLKKIKMKNVEFLSSLVILENLVKIPTSRQRSLVVSTMFDLFKEGVPGANRLEVFLLLSEASEKIGFDQLIMTAKEWFFLFVHKEKHEEILLGADSEPANYYYPCCINGLIAASREIETNGILKLLNPLSEKEKSEIVEMIKKLQVNSLEFHNTLEILLGVLFEERSELLDSVFTLRKFKMICDEGSPLSSFAALEKMAPLTSAKRAQVIKMLTELFEQGVPGANQIALLDFLIHTPENKLFPIIDIAKKVFFTFEDKEMNKEILLGIYKNPNNFFGNVVNDHAHCVLECLAKIRGIENFSQDQLIAFENIQTEKLKGYDERKKIIYKILFGNQRSIQHCVFDIPGQDYELFLWMERLIENSEDLDLQTRFEYWMHENEALVLFYNSYNVLLLAYNKIRKLSSQKNFVNYVTREEKPFPKKLKASHTLQNKACVKNFKFAAKYFLDCKFNAPEVKNVKSVPEGNYSVFYLKNAENIYDKYRVKENEPFVIKNDEKLINLNWNDSQLINRSALEFYLSGNRYETIKDYRDGFFLSQQKDTDPLPNEYWSYWLQGDENLNIYQNQIYPIISKAAITILQELPENSTLPVILDVGAGTGHLACSILNGYQKPLNYIMLEKNEDEIKIATNNVPSASVVSTDIVEDPLYYQDAAKTKPLEFNSVDIVLASGVLTRQVLKDKEDSLKALKKIYSYIKPDGFIILSGKQHSYISASDLMDAGFEVLNMSLPQSSTQFYIARKKT